jgi:hypothetical protein
LRRRRAYTAGRIKGAAMKTLIVLGMAVLMSGCVVIDREARFYTAADVDAITAQMECRQNARNYLQMARCDTWRR